MEYRLAVDKGGGKRRASLTANKEGPGSQKENKGWVAPKHLGFPELFSVWTAPGKRD